MVLLDSKECADIPKVPTELDNIKLFLLGWSRTLLTSPQLKILQMHLGNGLSPVTEGAELWAAECGAVLWTPQRENVLHQLTQSVITVRRKHRVNIRRRATAETETKTPAIRTTFCCLWPAPGSAPLWDSLWIFCTQAHPPACRQKRPETKRQGTISVILTQMSMMKLTRRGSYTFPVSKGCVEGIGVWVEQVPDVCETFDLELLRLFFYDLSNKTNIGGII